MTNNQARKLGDIIRQDINSNRKTSIENLSQLQFFRKTYEDPLSLVFKDLSYISKRVRNDRIVTYRIKRLDSIISKIKREPDRELDRMWDIGGCRCILLSQSAVDKVYTDLKKHFNVRREKNYIKEKKYDGYQGIHLYVDVPSCGKVVEIQLRTIKQHNWATLVEIIDLVYNRKIKEGEKNTPFNEFHAILSDIENATYEEKKKLITIEKENKIFETLFGIFLRNYLDVRKKWLELEEYKGHNFFTILVDKDAKPTIKSFELIEDAQQDYFDSYLDTDANIVLTHLQDPSYKQISQAYSNYILTTHQFISDWHQIVKEIIFHAHKNGLIKDFKEYIKIFDDYYLIEKTSIQEEVNSIKQKLAETGISKNGNGYKKVQEWIDDLEQRVEFRSEINKKIKSLNTSKVKQKNSLIEIIKKAFN
jgi:ppGpp synthetase/RelA/SpoT-type nucleotidyltranferase